MDGEWLVVEDDDRVCGGVHKCAAELGQVCGSLLDPAIRHLLYKTDDLGNQVPLGEEDLYKDSQIETLNYGITNFDNIFQGYITMF